MPFRRSQLISLMKRPGFLSGSVGGFTMFFVKTQTTIVSPTTIHESWHSWSCNFSTSAILTDRDKHRRVHAGSSLPTYTSFLGTCWSFWPDVMCGRGTIGRIYTVNLHFGNDWYIPVWPRTCSRREQGILVFNMKGTKLWSNYRKKWKTKLPFDQI